HKVPPPVRSVRSAPAPPPRSVSKVGPFLNKLKYRAFLYTRMNTNPSRGPYHFRAPSFVFWMIVRGTLPQRTKRGPPALEKLKVFDGILPPYDKRKSMVVPSSCENPSPEISKATDVLKPYGIWV
uniref:Uncharacterized protein n=1 Tax=Leptobrachium leishanense TaxID=445787 RepID=A0A8C5PGN3_9ANUR